MKVGNKILGLAIGQKSILIAEVVTKGERHAVTHCGEFVFPEGLALGLSEKLGQALHQFLRERHITTKDVVIGLPAKRLVTRRKEIPPSSVAIAASTLRVQAEGEFSSDLDNLVTDFAGTPSPTEPTTVLLIATKKNEVDECELMAKAAGLRVHAITSTTAALGRATSRLPGGDGLVLALGPNGAELVIQHGVDPILLRHLNIPGGTDSINALAIELRLTMTSIARNGTPMTLAVWNSSGIENAQSVLEQRLAIPVTAPEVSNLVITDTVKTEGFAPAIALALTAFESGGFPVDFLHSRLAPPKVAALSNEKRLGIAAGILVVALGAAGYVLLNDEYTKIDQLNAAMKKKEYTVATSQAAEQLKRFEFVKKWWPKGPLNIQVLRDVTQVFPPQGDTIWATSFGNSHDIYTWELDGKATNQQYVYDVVDKMRQVELFLNPKINSLLWEPNARQWTFRISFIYNAPKGPSALLADENSLPGSATRAGGPNDTNGFNRTNMGGRGGMGAMGGMGGMDMTGMGGMDPTGMGGMDMTGMGGGRGGRGGRGGAGGGGGRGGRGGRGGGGGPGGGGPGGPGGPGGMGAPGGGFGGGADFGGMGGAADGTGGGFDAGGGDPNAGGDAGNGG